MSLFRAAELFCAVVAQEHPHERVSMDRYAFARAVDELTKEGNRVASGLRVYNGPAGRACLDFDEMMSLALHAGLVSYLSPEYTHFLSNLSPRGAATILRRIEATDAEVGEMRQLVEAHLRHAR